MKKLLSMVLALSLLSTLLCSCVGTTTSLSSSHESSEISQDVSSTGTEAVEYVPTKDLKLSFWFAQGSDAPEDIGTKIKDNVVQDYLTKKTKVTIDPADVKGNNGQNWSGALTMMVAGNTLPNVVNCSGSGAIPIISTLLEGDMIYELTPELLNQYCPNIMAKTSPDIWKNVTVDGKIYGIPSGLKITPLDKSVPEELKSYPTGGPNTSQGGAGYAIRDDIAKELFGVKSYDEMLADFDLAVKNGTAKDLTADDFKDIPLSSTDDWVKMFRDIKALDIKEGNSNVWAFGIPSGDSWSLFTQLMGPMCGTWGFNMLTYFDINTKTVKFSMEEPLYRDFGKTLNTLVNDKVIDPESLVHNAQQYKEKVLAGKYAVINLDRVGMAGLININNELKAQGQSFRYRPIVSQVPTADGYIPYNQPPTVSIATMFFKTLSEEDLIQALNYYEQQYTDEFEEIFWWGTPEADLYVDNADGTRTFKDDRFTARFIDGKSDALPIEETMGIGQIPYARIITPYGDGVNKFKSNILNKTIVVPTDIVVATNRYKPDSDKIPQAMGPSAALWDGIYSGIPQAKTVMDAWPVGFDNYFKAALGAKNEAEFNKNWDAGLAKLNELGLQEAKAEMTKIAADAYDKMN